MHRARISATFDPMKLTVMIYDKYFTLSLYETHTLRKKANLSKVKTLSSLDEQPLNVWRATSGCSTT
jgi:hypothetical protein